MPETEMVYLGEGETNEDSDGQQIVDDSSDPEYEVESKHSVKSPGRRPRKNVSVVDLKRGGRKKDNVWSRFTQQMLGDRAVATCNRCGQHMFPRAYSCKMHLTKCSAGEGSDDASKCKQATPASNLSTRIKRPSYKLRAAAETITVSHITSADVTDEYQTTQIQYEVVAPVSPPAPKFPSNLRLGIIGGGVMAKSIMFPLFEQGLVDPYNVIVAGNTAETLGAWTDRGCTAVTNNNSKVFDEAHIIIWALKPQVFPKAMEVLVEEYAEKCSQTMEINLPLHISVMAGITLEQFTNRISTVHDGHTAVIPRTVRTMPNIGHRVSVGSTVFTMGINTDDEDRKIVQSLFASTGVCLEVPESQVNGFGALTGSGIGFMFPILESLSDGAVKVGLRRDLALKMAAQTMRGAAELFLKEGKHPGALKDCACSPGGSTIAGIAELEKAGVRIAFINALDAANKRSEEIGSNHHDSLMHHRAYDRLLENSYTG